MKYIYLLAVLLVSLETNAQCSVKNYKASDGELVREANFEILYKNVGENNNGDYSKGFTQIHSRLSKISASSSLTDLWQLQVMVGTKWQTPLTPRKLIFYFTDGSALTINAATYKELPDDVQMCEFDITDQMRTQLKRPIQQVEIIDTRSERMYVGKKQFGLYDRVLAEQINCLN